LAGIGFEPFKNAPKSLINLAFVVVSPVRELNCRAAKYENAHAYPSPP